MKRRTPLYNNKRETVCELLDAREKATKLDADLVDLTIDEVKAAKSTVQLNRIIKRANMVWRKLNLSTF